MTVNLYDDPGPHGKFVVWLDYGSEGWQPYSFDTADDAVEAVKQAATNWVMTSPVKLVPTPNQQGGDHG